jgi:hypothetical protein
MSISRRIYEFGLKIKEITSRKSFNTLLISFFAMFLFFGVFNVYALEVGESTPNSEEIAEEEVTFEPAWKETKWWHNIASKLSGDKKDEDNMNSRQGVESLNTAWTVVTLLIPEVTGATDFGDSEEESPVYDAIPNDLKRGLLGMVDDASTTAYAIYPVINVPEHLAQQWVPGYRESSVSTFAADSGYEALNNSGISAFWTKSLNLSYVFFIVVMVIAGFMIMFRHKLGGQAMVTLGTILPQVIICLLLATFSFAIAGLIIDLAGVINSLIAYMLFGNGKVSPIFGIGELINGALGGDGTIVGTIQAVTKMFGSFMLFGIYEENSALGILHAARKVLTFLFEPGKAVKVGVTGMLLIIFVVGIMFLGAVRVTITLFKAYFGILVNVILAPIQLTIAAIPGNSHMIKNWLSSLLRNVMVFPVVLFIVNVPRAIEETFGGGDISFALPGKLVGQEPGVLTNILNEQYDAGRVIVMFLRIFVLFYAAQAPKFLESVFPPTTPKAFAEGMASGKMAVSKVPLVGRFFREKR